MFPTFQNTRPDLTPPSGRKKYSLAKGVQDRPGEPKRASSKKEKERPSSVVALLLGCEPENLCSGIEADITHLRKKLRSAKNWGASKADMIFVTDILRQISDIYFATVIGLMDSDATEEVYELSAKALLEVKPLRLALEKKSEETKFTWAGGNVAPKAKEDKQKKRQELERAFKSKNEARGRRNDLEVPGGSQRYASSTYLAQDPHRISDSRGYSERNGGYEYEDSRAYQPSSIDERRTTQEYRSRSEEARVPDAPKKRAHDAERYNEMNSRYAEDDDYRFSEYQTGNQASRSQSSFDIVRDKYFDEERYTSYKDESPTGIVSSRDREPRQRSDRYTNSKYGTSGEYQSERDFGTPKALPVRGKGYGGAYTSTKTQSRKYISDGQSRDISTEESIWDKTRVSQNTGSLLSELEGTSRRDDLNPRGTNTSTYLPYREPSGVDSVYNQSSVSTHRNTRAENDWQPSPRRSNIDRRDSETTSARGTSSYTDDRSYSTRRYPEYQSRRYY
ncbi:hypothetical protein AA313_de0200612 [Arthrobotrys entomopaga]|nr:hypothetical protein AA313_de0200612 [Arthrobotrys entomopaga]